MIVRIQASGGSFLGAGKYYLHDKAHDAGIERSLKRLGVQRGDTVKIGEQEFAWMDEADRDPMRTPARRRKNYRTAFPTPE